MNGQRSHQMPADQNREFDALLSRIAESCAQLAELTPTWTDSAGMDRRDKKLKLISDQIQAIRHQMDPGKHEIISISLGRPDALSRFFAFNFVESETQPLENLSSERFFGSGVYAIYYAGNDIPPYQPISGTETPIYVGKAVPSNRTAETAFDQGPVLWKRLREHRKSIDSGGLKAADFRYRRAIIQSGMEGAVEDFMIRLFKPIWNKEFKICYGIGKHGDSAQTRGNKRSPWDTMHPGRAWAAATVEDQASQESIVLRIDEHFKKHRPIANKSELYSHLSLH